MSVYNLIILSGAAAAALVAWGRWRYLAWLGAMMASYALSVLYWDFGLPRADFFAACCDFAVCASILTWAMFQWELWVARAVMVSFLINCIYLFSNLYGLGLIEHVIYASALEALNIIVILTIGGTAAFDKAGMTNGVGFRPWIYVFGVMRPVYRRRAKGE